MKRSKALSILLAMLMVLGSLSCLTVVSSAANLVAVGYTPDTANAEDPNERVTAWEFYDDGVLYLYDNPGAVAWTAYADQITSVVVKAKTADSVCGVTSIPAYSFYDCKKLATVDFSGGADVLQIIGAYAFNGCSALTEVKLPNSVVTLGDYAFYGCSALEKVTLSASLENVGKNVFKGCGVLETVNVPNGVATIGYGMFEDCAVLSDVVLPDSVVAINDHAFEGCSALTAIIVPDSVSDIGNYAFYETGIKTAYIGHSVTNVGSYVFGRCTALEEVTFTSGINTIGDWMFYGCSALKTIVDFPESVDVIGAHAFEGCSALTAIVVPNTVTEIGESAFAGCSALADVTLSTALREIGANAFNGSAITTIEIPYGVASIGAGAFAACSALTAINVAAANTVYKSVDGVLYTADLASLITCPAGKTGEVTVADGTAEIGANAFLGCDGVTVVTIPASVTAIDATAFNGCSDTLTIKASCNAYALDYAKLFGIATDPQHTGKVEWVVTTEPTCETPGEKTQFCADCGENEGVTELIDALGHNYDNGVITTPAKCETDGVVTFTCQNEGCLDSYTESLPATGHNWDGGNVIVEPTCDATGTKRFTCQNEGCYSYQDFTLPATGHNYDEGTVITAPTCDATGTIEYKCTDDACSQSYTDVIPATGHNLSEPVEELAPICEADGYYLQECQNDGCAYFVSTVIPATGHKYDKGVITKYPTVKAEGEITYTCQNEWCTEDHANHTYVVYIANTAFAGIYATNDGAYADENGDIQNLTWLITDEFDLYVFADDTAEEWGIYRDLIVTATITGDATTVENGSFAKMPELKEAYILLNLGTIEAYAFQLCPKLEIVVTGSIESLGEYAFYDCESLQYVDIYGGLPEDKVGIDVFNSCENLSTVILGNGTLSLGDAMFKGCSSLAEITLPESMVVIGDSAFDGTALTTITIPTNIREIKKGAFTNCTELTAINVDNKNDFYFSVDGVLYDMELGSLELCPAGKTGEVAVWEGSSSIAADAFIGCKGVTMVAIPNSVTAIADNAFNNCAPALVIKGNCDSYGIAFAKARGIATEITHVASSAWQTTLAPTCLEKGTEQLVCTGCGEVFETKELEALGHNYDKGVVTTDATCEADGIMTYTCTRTDCTASYTKPIPATKHNFDSGKVISAATCEATGTMRYTCQNAGCLESYDEEIKALGHSLDAGTVIVAVTCEADGTKLFKCQNTGCLHEIEETIPALGHNYVAVEIKAASCISEGKIQHTCSNCGDSYIENTVGTHPQTVTATVAPTCTQSGKTGEWCAVCSQFVGTVTETPATGHSYKNGTCAVCGDTTAQQPSNPGGTVITPEQGGSENNNQTSAKPATPKLLLLVNRNEGLILTWNAVDGAKAYRVYRRGAGEKSWTYLTTVTGTTYVDSKAETGKYWRYTVRATNDAGYSGFENGLYIKRVDTPHMTGISNIANGVKISWSSISNAKSYKIYRRGAGETWKCIATVGASATSYTDTAIKNKSGNYYRYTVRAIDGYYSAYEDGLLTKYVAAPRLKGIANTSNGVKVNWNSVNGADSYRVYRRGAGQSWVYVTTVTGTSYVDTNVKNANGYYRYTVRAVDGGRYSGYEAGLLIKR